MVDRRVALALLLAVGACTGLASAQQGRRIQPGPDSGCAWGRDVNPGAGEKLAAAVRSELLAIVRASANGRAAKAAALAKQRSNASIEGWKRFRNPELLPLARACLADPDWHVVHRALHWLRYLRDPSLLSEAWPLTTRAEARLREKAVITCIEAWDADAAKSLEGGRLKETLVERGARETDPHVRQALLALLRRVEGTLAPTETSPEIVQKLGDGLLWTPFLRGWTHLDEVAPQVHVASRSDPSRTSAVGLPIATSWMFPLLGFGTEEVPGIHLQPFGNSRRDGAYVHTGQDVGGCMDGSGFYALGDGIVRLLASGSDCGTLIVVEHHVPADSGLGLAGSSVGSDAAQLMTAIYMHAGGTVFVTSGETVSAGQLLGTMGLSFSIENGGHFAHLHLGLYPGPFVDGHNYGYGRAGERLEEWHDPAVVLPRLVDPKRVGDGKVAPKKK